METKTVLINIPELIEDYMYAKAEEDGEECIAIKERFHKFYSECKAELKPAVSKFILNFLDKQGIKDDKDLDGLFRNVSI